MNRSGAPERNRAHAYAFGILASRMNSRSNFEMKKFPKPDSSADRKINSVIKNQGWCVIDVADAPIPFAYTVGLSLNFGHPEILVSGMDTSTHGCY